MLTWKHDNTGNVGAWSRYGTEAIDGCYCSKEKRLITNFFSERTKTDCRNAVLGAMTATIASAACFVGAGFSYNITTNCQTERPWVEQKSCTYRSPGNFFEPHIDTMVFDFGKHACLRKVASSPKHHFEKPFVT